MTENDFIELMSAAITETDGTEAESLEMFELRVLERNDPQLVWDLFAAVRLPLLRRLYGMAQYQLNQTSEAQSSPRFASPINRYGTASEPHETVDNPPLPIFTRDRVRHSAVSPFDSQRRITTTSTSRSPRNAASAQSVLMAVGDRKSYLDSITNHRGKPIGDLTYMGLANADDETPIFRRYARRLMECGIPRTGRQSDIVRRFITPDEADRMWLDLFSDKATDVA